MSDIPEGFGPAEARAHGFHLALAVEVVNRTDTYLESEDGTDENRVAEMALAEHVDQIIGLGPEVTSSVILALASILHHSGDQAKAQEFLAEQKAAIESVLGP